MGNNLSTLKIFKAIRARLEDVGEKWSYRSSNTYDLMPGKISNIKIVCEPSLKKREAAYNLQLKEWPNAFCGVYNSSRGRLSEIGNEISVMKGEAEDNLQLDEEEKWHDALCDVSSLDKFEEMVNEQFKVKVDTVDNQEEEEWHDTLSNVSDSLSDTVKEQSMMERKAADLFQIKEEEEMSDTLCNVSDSLSETQVDIVNEQLIKDDHSQIRGEVNDALRHNSNSSSGRLSEKEVVEEQSVLEKPAAGSLKLKDKDEEFNDGSFDVLPAKSSHNLQPDPTMESNAAVHLQQKDKVSAITPLTQDVTTSTSDLKKDELQLETVAERSIIEKQIAGAVKLKEMKEESHERPSIVPDISPKKSGNIMPSDPNTERKAAEELHLKDKDEESHERSPIVPDASPDKSYSIVPSDVTNERNDADRVQLTGKDEGSHDRSPKIPNASPARSDSILPSDPHIEGEAAEELQRKNNDEEFCDRSHHVLNISHGKSANILSDGANTESKAADHVQLIDKDEESCVRSPNVPNVSSSKHDNIPPYGPTLRRKGAEDLQLKNKDKESHEGSPKVLRVFPGKSGNIPHSDPNFSTAESVQNTQFTQATAPSNNKLKKDPLQCKQEPLSLQSGFKLNPKAEVFMPQVKNLASSSTTAVVKIIDHEQRPKLAAQYNIPPGSGEIIKIESEQGFIQNSSAGKLKDVESSHSVTNKFQLNPNAHEFLPRLKNLPLLGTESAETLKHTHATSDNNATPLDRDLTQPKSATRDFTQKTDEIESFPDQRTTSNDQSQPTAKSAGLPDVVTSNKISVFDPLTVDTSFDDIPEDLFYFYAAGLAYGNNVQNSDSAVDASQKMPNTLSTTASTIDESDYQLPSNNLHPPNSKFCPTPGCRYHVDGRCSRAPMTAQSDTGATVPDTQQEYLRFCALPDSSDVHSATRMNPRSDLLDPSPVTEGQTD